jgi:transcriptional regulator with XRE-family HTH domain
VVAQSIRGTLGTVEALAAQVDRARSAKSISWTRLARGFGVSRQYLRSTLGGEVVPLSLLQYLARVLDLRPSITVAADLAPMIHFALEPQPHDQPHVDLPAHLTL